MARRVSSATEHLFAHQKHLLIPLHLLVQGRIQGLSYRELHTGKQGASGTGVASPIRDRAAQQVQSCTCSASCCKLVTGVQPFAHLFGPCLCVAPSQGAQALA